MPSVTAVPQLCSPHLSLVSKAIVIWKVEPRISKKRNEQADAGENSKEQTHGRQEAFGTGRFKYAAAKIAAQKSKALVHLLVEGLDVERRTVATSGRIWL
ncbi:unnamed protein product [Dicrocoelium dendriticum]|nr:unnamed protein product [Dicrocoelium dendriticum]